MKYRLRTQEFRATEMHSNECWEDYNILLQKRYWSGWRTLRQYRPYNAEEAIKELDQLIKMEAK